MFHLLWDTSIKLHCQEFRGQNSSQHISTSSSEETKVQEDLKKNLIDVITSQQSSMYAFLTRVESS